MKSIITQMLTGKDGSTYDIVRFLGFLAVLEALGLAVYSVAWLKQPFDMQAYGTGLGVVFGGLGAALKLKETTEPAP